MKDDELSRVAAKAMEKLVCRDMGRLRLPASDTHELVGDIELVIDLDALWHKVAAKALRSRTRKATTLGGAIKVIARNVKTEPKQAA